MVPITQTINEEVTNQIA